jgi:hypothetical protein
VAIPTGVTSAESTATNITQQSNLQDGQNFLNTAANKYIVKPKNAAGIGGFVFDYEGEDSVTYTSEITDHYLETNDPVQDHIAQRPVRIVLRGFVSELSQKAPAGVVGALATIQSKLTTVPAYLGKYTPGAIQGIQKALTTAQATANQINLALAKVQNVVGMLPGATPQKSKQQKAFAQLQALWLSRQVFTVQTPYTYFSNMVIESISFIQPEETTSWSDISITLKQMRFVQVQTVANSSKFAGRAALQRQPQASQGKTQGTPADVSLLYKFATGGL